ASRKTLGYAWSHVPNSGGAGLSVAVCQITPVRSARSAGILIPKSVVDDCTAYIKDCQDKMGGWFKYTKRGGGAGGADSMAWTAAGVCALYAAGIYKGREVEDGLKFIARHKPGGRLFRAD